MQLAQNAGGAKPRHVVIQIRQNTYERLDVLVAELNNWKVKRCKGL